jgi:hypothetical protein
MIIGTVLTQNVVKELLEQPNVVDGSTGQIPNVIQHAVNGRRVQLLDSSRGDGVTVAWWGYPPDRKQYRTSDYMDPRAIVADVLRYLTTGDVPHDAATI